MHRPIQLTKTTSSRRTSQVTRRKKLHSLIAGLRPAASILARRIAFPLLLLTAGLVLVQPCAGQSGTWTATGSLPPHAMITRRRCCPTARCSSQAVLTASSRISRARNSTIRRAGPGRPPAASPPHASSHTATLLPNGKVLVAGGLHGVRLASAELYDPASGTWTATGSLATARDDHTATLLPNGKVLVAGGARRAHRSRERGTLRSGERDLDGHRQPRHRTLRSHGDVAAQRQGARRRRMRQLIRRSRERGTLRSGERDLDGHRQPRHRTRCSHGDVAAQRQGARRRRIADDFQLSRERGTLRSGERDLDGHRQPRHRTLGPHGDVAAQRQGARRRRL